MKIKKIIGYDQIWLTENFDYINELKELFTGYLKTPGSIAKNKKIHDIYKNLNLSDFKEEDLDKKVDREKKIKEFIEMRDMILPKFEHLDLKNAPKPKSFMSMFKSSFHGRPMETDLNPTPVKKEGLNTHNKTIFPTYKMIDESAIPKMELDTLFFIFYYQKNSYEKFVAAKELKKRDWRFNKKYNIWFKRHEQPRTTTPEWENGNFLIFDCEATWKVKKRKDFTFKYKHLEDEI